ncbi:hypothetical protein [Propioniciclava flava]
MATDHARGRYWVLDKSSGRLTLTAIKPDGTVEGTMNSRDNLTNAQALAFDSGEAYVGDMGEAGEDQVTVYRVTEPWPGTEILKAIAYPLTYPDGGHDAAAILVESFSHLGGHQGPQPRHFPSCLPRRRVTPQPPHEGGERSRRGDRRGRAAGRTPGAAHGDDHLRTGRHQLRHLGSG